MFTVRVPGALDGTGSSDPDGDSLSYHWDWGDATSSPARLEHIAARCRRAGIVADNLGIEVRFLAEERRTLVALAAVAGYDAPIKVAPTFTTMTEDEAQRILDELPL